VHQLAQRLLAVAFIAAGLVIVDVVLEVGLAFDGNVVLTVQVLFTLPIALAKLLEDRIEWRVAEVIQLEVTNDVRLPAAVDACPSVTLEADDTEPQMLLVVSSAIR
jgi:hypothetical protein